MSRRILIADLHLAGLLLSAALAQTYRSGAVAAGHEVRTATLSKMSFNPDVGQSGFCNDPPGAGT